MKLRIDFKTIKDSVLSFFKRQFGTRKRVILFVLVAVLMVTYAVLGLVTRSMIADLPQYLLADRWSEDERMAQVSLYVTEDQLIDEDSLKRFEYELEKKLVAAGVMDPDAETDEDKAGEPKVIDTIGIDEMNNKEEEVTVKERTGIRRLFAVAYCAQGQATLTFENRTADNVAAIGCAGDFFLFHPLTFVSGGAFSGDDLMKDSIVLDEDMAWQLFGSTDIVGQCVTISDVPHYICGVVKKDTGRIAKASGLDKSYVYMSYDSLSKYGTILSGRVETKEVSEDGVTAQRGGISCVEVVCPNPVNGLAARTTKESLGVSDEFVSVIDDTDRFSFFSLLSVIRSFGLRSMWNKAIFYPYWENMARGYEDILATVLLIRIICLVTAVVIITISIVNAYRHKKWTIESVVRYLSDKKYDLEAEYKQKHMKEKSVDA